MPAGNPSRSGPHCRRCGAARACRGAARRAAAAENAAENHAEPRRAQFSAALLLGGSP